MRYIWLIFGLVACTYQAFASNDSSHGMSARRDPIQDVLLRLHNHSSASYSELSIAQWLGKIDMSKIAVFGVAYTSGKDWVLPTAQVQDALSMKHYFEELARNLDLSDSPKSPLHTVRLVEIPAERKHAPMEYASVYNHSEYGGLLIMHGPEAQDSSSSSALAEENVSPLISKAVFLPFFGNDLTVSDLPISAQLALSQRSKLAKIGNGGWTALRDRLSSERGSVLRRVEYLNALKQQLAAQWTKTIHINNHHIGGFRTAGGILKPAVLPASDYFRFSKRRSFQWHELAGTSRLKAMGEFCSFPGMRSEGRRAYLEEASRGLYFATVLGLLQETSEIPTLRVDLNLSADPGKLRWQDQSLEEAGIASIYIGPRGRKTAYRYADQLDQSFRDLASRFDHVTVFPQFSPIRFDNPIRGRLSKLHRSWEIRVDDEALAQRYIAVASYMNRLEQTFPWHIDERERGSKLDTFRWNPRVPWYVPFSIGLQFPDGTTRTRSIRRGHIGVDHLVNRMWAQWLSSHLSKEGKSILFSSSYKSNEIEETARKEAAQLYSNSVEWLRNAHEKTLVDIDAEIKTLQDYLATN